MKYNRFEKHSKKILAGIFFVFLLLTIFGTELLLSFSIKEHSISTQTRSIRLREHSPSTTRHYTAQNIYRKENDTMVQNEIRLKIDADGYIYPSNIHQKPDLNLLFLGGSTTECSLVDEENRFPYLVGRLLEDDGNKVNAFNSGKSGNHSMHSINILLNKGLALKPDIAVMMHNINDLSLLLYENNYWNNNLSRSLLVVSNPNDTWYQIKNVVKSIIPRVYERMSIFKKRYLKSNANQKDEFAHLRGNQILVNKPEIIDQFKRSLLTFVVVSKANQILPVLMTQANRFKEKPDKKLTSYRTLMNDFGISYVDYKDIYDAMNQSIREVAATNNVLLIDLAKKVPQEENYMYDAVHLNDNGSIYVASIIAGRLEMALNELPDEISKN